MAAYRDTFRLLLVFAQARTGKAPSVLDFSDLGADLIGAFLEHLEHDRHNSVRTRNARLAAVRSFFRFASYREPAHAELIARVLAIPDKRDRRAVVSFLTAPELNALVASPDLGTWTGRRDQALLVTAAQAGLRVSELVGLSNQDVVLGAGAPPPGARQGPQGALHAPRPARSRCAGELAQGAGWTRLAPQSSRPGGAAPSATTPLPTWSPSTPPSPLGAARALHTKKVTPHTLRHSSAMQLLHAGVDTSVIALWLGHEHLQTTQIYLHGDLSVKERALARTAPLDVLPGRYRPSDKLLAFLEGL